MTDFIKLYNREELKALKSTGTYVSMSFRWHFAEVRGFQTSISSSSEIGKFFDTMQENRFDWNFDTGLLGKISKFESKLYLNTSKEIFKFSKRFGFSSCARNTLSRALVQYRIIRSVIKNGDILEIGPGSGLLGVLLGKDLNYSYTGMETCQAFYVTQHELWKNIFGVKANESFKKFNKNNINHLPWWNFANLDFKIPQFDCVTANHVFAEMHEMALVFTIKRIHMILKNNGIVICEGIGSTHDMSTERVLDEFLKQGFSIFHIGKINKITGFKNIFIFIKMSKINNYSVNPHLFLLAKGNEISVRSVRKTFGHIKRGIVKSFGFKLRFLKSKLNEEMVFSKEKVLKSLNNIEKNSKPSKNDIFLRFIEHS